MASSPSFVPPEQGQSVQQSALKGEIGSAAILWGMATNEPSGARDSSGGRHEAGRKMGRNEAGRATDGLVIGALSGGRMSLEIGQFIKVSKWSNSN